MGRTRSIARERRLTIAAFRHRRQLRTARPSKSRAAATGARGPWSARELARNVPPARPHGLHLSEGGRAGARPQPARATEPRALTSLEPSPLTIHADGNRMV